jgi:signal transduction histidine kinase
MLRATERERARIARDMHDEIGGSLTKIGKLAAGLPDPAIAETTREVVLAMDQVVWTVNPRNDSLDSLATYLVHYTEEFLRPAGIACELDIPLILPEVMLASDVRHNLFLATKEALNNAVKHGAPRRVRLGLTVAGGLLSLTVRDDGCGFSPATTAAGADGLGNMRDRLTAIGGELHLISGPGQGTTITMQVSLKPTKPL